MVTMWHRVWLLAGMVMTVAAGELVYTQIVQYISDYDELNTMLLNTHCIIFHTSDNCEICQGVNLQWLARYLNRVGRSVLVVHVNSKANSNLTHFFTKTPPSVLANKDGLLIEFGDDIYLISVVQWLESIFPVVHDIPTKVWFSDEVFHELQEDDLTSHKRITLAVIFFSHTTIAKGKHFVHYRQVLKGKLTFYFVDVGSEADSRMAGYIGGRNRFTPQVLYISSEGRATGPRQILPLNTFEISTWISATYDRDMYVSSLWKGSDLIKKLTDISQLKIIGNTTCAVILFVRGRTQISALAYNTLF